MSVSPNSFLSAYALSRLAETSYSGEDASARSILLFLIDVLGRCSSLSFGYH